MALTRADNACAASGGVASGNRFIVAAPFVREGDVLIAACAPDEGSKRRAVLASK